MRQDRSSDRRYPIHEKALPASDLGWWYGKLGDTRKSDQSLFGLLLDIESRLRTEARDVQIERLKRSKVEIRQRTTVNNLSRYRE